MVDRIHERGFQCWVWTVNQEAQMERLIREKVDAIITDDPKKLLDLLKNSPPPPE